MTRSPTVTWMPVLPHVRVRGGDGGAVDVVFDDDQPAPTTGELCDGHHSIRCSENLSSVGGRKIGTGMEGVLAGEGIDARTKVTRVNPGAFRQRKHDSGGFRHRAR